MFEFKDHFNANNCTMRLLDDYKKHGNLIVAFDFDNTIYDYHDTGASFSCVENLLRECSELGFTMILFTANENKEKLDFCKLFCSQCGIRIDYINESPVMNTRKPYYNILLDDRAGLEEAYKTLRYLVEIIKLSKSCKR